MGRSFIRERVQLTDKRAREFSGFFRLRGGATAQLLANQLGAGDLGQPGALGRVMLVQVGLGNVGQLGLVQCAGVLEPEQLDAGPGAGGPAEYRAQFAPTVDRLDQHCAGMHEQRRVAEAGIGGGLDQAALQGSAAARQNVAYLECRDIEQKAGDAG
nr:hypothetical protein FFPRI1PSEUD_48350 [Pseudomonas sp. FFPRI_1]